MPSGARCSRYASPPSGHDVLGTVRDEEDVLSALEDFVQADAALARAVVKKLSAIAVALERSHFFGSHVFLRSALLLTYDDAAREYLLLMPQAVLFQVFDHMRQMRRNRLRQLHAQS